MKSTIIKRSIVLKGHKTSVSLETEFWEGLREIACAQKIKLTELAQQVDERRQGNNLSSAIRVFVFNHLRAQIARAQTSQQILPERPMEQRRLSA
jgi:predicted DNA-binding ribbon-helix-helix protein